MVVVAVAVVVVLIVVVVVGVGVVRMAAVVEVVILLVEGIERDAALRHLQAGEALQCHALPHQAEEAIPSLLVEDGDQGDLNWSGCYPPHYLYWLMIVVEVLEGTGSASVGVVAAVAVVVAVVVVEAVAVAV